MNELYIPLILGTAREGRESEKIARYMEKQMKAAGISTEIVDVRDFMHGKTLPPEEDHAGVKPWRERVVRADGFVLVVPEYDRGYPGELKIFLDSVYDEYARKPIGICGVSSGPYGGARVAEHILPVLKHLGLITIRNVLYFGEMPESFDDAAGEPKDSKYKGRISNFLKDLLWYAETLKHGREHIK